MSRLFVSYRRDDAANDAGRLAEHLRAHFGVHNVFIDVDTIEYGEDFVEKIQREVGSSDILLAVIGRGWLAAKDDGGHRRIDNPEDFVRIEIGTALKRNIRVVPVLVQRATMPKEGDLPEDLAGLLRRNALEIRETQFARDVDALIDSLAGRRRSGLAGLLWRPQSWAIAGVLVIVLAAGLITRHALRPSPAEPPPSPLQPAAPAATSLFDVPLKLRMYLSDRFGAVDPKVKLTLLHKAPRYEASKRYLETQSNTPPPFEYESSVWMPAAKGQSYIGEVQRITETGFKVDGSSPGNADTAARRMMEVCFERKAEVTDRDAAVNVECQEGSACRVADSTSVRPCRGHASQGGRWIGVAHAQSNRPEPDGAAREPHWVVPSLATLRTLKGGDKGVGYTEFSLVSSALPGLREADGLIYAIRVNGTPVYIDGWPPAAHRTAFEAIKGLSLEFGLENLDFSGKHAGVEEIDIALEFSQGARVLQKQAIRLRYVALRDAAECAVKATDDLTIRWRAHYVHPRREDVYQIFLLATPSVKAAEARKKQIDGARLPLDGKEVVAVVRPPITTNPSYGVALGLRQPTGQVKFTFDSATAQRLQKGVVDLAARTKLIEATAYPRNVGSRTETTPCPSS